MVVLEVTNDVRPQAARRTEAMQKQDRRLSGMPVAAVADHVQPYAVDDQVGPGQRMWVVHPVIVVVRDTSCL